MKDVRDKKLVAIIISVTVCLVAIIILSSIALKSEKKENKSWIIKSYNNSVALYYGDDIETIYSEIEIDTLPDEDKRILNNGIAFTTRDEAVRALEDYDG